MGDDIDPYLINSFQMAMLVSSQGEYGSEGEWGSFDADTASKRLQCLLLYDGNFHLCGHAVGAPKEAEDGVWQMEVTLCDYDFTELYEQQRSAFEAPAGGDLFQLHRPGGHHSLRRGVLPAGLQHRPRSPRCCPAIPRPITSGPSTPPPMWQSTAANWTN